MATVHKTARRVGVLVALATILTALALWASPAQAAGTPSAVANLVSTTHPSQSTWYPLTNAAFTWSAATESGGTIAGYSFTFDQNASGLPPVLSGAALSYGARVNYTVGSSPAEIRVADLNGDGKLDLVAENSGANTVSVLLGNGDGTFKAAVNYTTDSNPWSLQVGDVNGDGKLDIVTCNESASTVSVLLGNGDGTFKSAVNYTTGSGTSPECMRLGDLTGGGSLDIITANAGTNNISVLKNNGNGTFAAPVMYSTATHPTSIAIGDLNGDGKQDVVTANYETNNVSVLIGNGDGTFKAAVNDACGTTPQTVELADCNGDGHLDIVTANYDGTASVLLNKGDGTFATHVDYATGAGPYSLSLADLNHDGYVDIVTVNHTANTVSVLLGNGDGTFQAHSDYSTGNGPFWVGLGDFNGDGYGDIAVTNYTDGTVSVLLGSGYYRPASGKLAASFSGVHDGTWYFHVRAIDTAGVAGPPSSYQINVDTVAPVTTAAGLQGSASTGWIDTQTVTLTATDTTPGVATSGVATTYYTLDGTQHTYSGPFQVNTAGSHTITYWSVDKAGNTEGAHTGYVNIDLAAPTTTATTNPTGWTNGSVQVTLAASDTGGSGVDTTSYKIGNGDPQTYSGPFTVSNATPIAYWSTDKAGNVESQKSLTPMIDTVAPVTTATTNPSGWTDGDVTVTLSATDDGGSGLDTTYYQVGSGSVKTYGDPFTVSSAAQVTYWSTDNAGNEETHHTLTPQIDLTAPVTTAATDPSGWTDGDVTVTLSATDDGGSGLDATYYRIGDADPQTYSAPFIVSDATPVTYWSTDKAGNEEQPETLTPQIDLTAPVTTATMDPSGWTDHDVTVTLAASDTGGSGVDTTSYKIGNGDPQTYSGPFTVSNATPIAYWSTDTAGNVEDATSNMLTPQIDTTAPVVTDDVATAWQHSAQKVTISASDEGGSGLASLSCTVDGVDQQLPAAGGSFTVAAQGVHTIVYSATDNAGNQSTPVTRELRIDTTAPVTTATTDPSGWSKGSVTVTLAATDTGGSGLDTTYYRIGDGDRQTYSAPFEVSDATPVTYWSTDKAGNAEDATGNVLTPQIDTTAPVTSSADLSTNDDSDWQPVSEVDVVLAATDTQSGVAQTYYRLGSSGPFSPYTEALPISGDGSHEIDYYSVDNVGNPEKTEEGWVNIDATPPTIDVSGLQSAPDSGWQTTAQQVTLEARDTGSGVAAVTYAIDGVAQPAYAQPFTVSGDGSHVVTYSAVDEAGNVASGYGYVNIDTMAPQTTASPNVVAAPDTDFVLDAQDVTLTASDGESGVAHTYYTLDGGPQTDYTVPFTVAGVGSHTITYWSVDALGNREDPHTGYVNIAPAEALLTLATGLSSNAHSGWTATPVTVELTANDAAQQSGTYSVVTHYRIDGSGWQTYSAPFDISASGSHRVEYYSSDSLGATEQTNTGYVNIDTTPPVTVASGPTTPQRTATVVTLNPSDAQSGVASTFYALDKQAPQRGTTVVVPAPSNHSMDGVHTISYYSVDEAGNVEAAHVFTVRIDTIRPVFTYRGATSFTARRNGTLKLKLRARDAGGTCTLVVKLTRKVGKKVTTYQRTVVARHTSNWQTVKLGLRGLPRGKYTVVLRLSDPAGNLSTAKTIHLTVS